MLYAIIVVCLIVAGSFLWFKFGNPVIRFTDLEENLINNRIEQIKTKDIAAYNALKEEWDDIKDSGIAKGQTISDELKQIIGTVKTL
jgi:hypothetical protein